MIFYKTMDGTAGAYGHGKWSLPVGKRPGKWMPKVKPVLCESGYHVCRDPNEVLVHSGPELYEVEVRGAHEDGDDKAAWEQARLVRRIPEWNERNLRLFAVDCARAVAHLTDDPDLTNACLDVCVAYAEFGNAWDAACDAAWAAVRAAAWDATGDAAGAAAWAAAWAAACDAAWAAVRDATWDATGDAAGAAAWAAAGAAAWAAAGAAAWAAAGVAAWDVARAAARDAVRAAAWAAAGAAARDAVGDAACDAAGAAARDAAWDAAGDAQVDLLARYLAGAEGPFIEQD